jgi:signal transduction histidine kinase
MSAPVCFGEKKYGILSVGADRRYEFSEEPDLHILGDLSSIAGATLARLDAEEKSKAAFTEFSERMGHTLNTRIAALEGTIAVAKIGKGSQHRIEVGKLEEVVEFLKRTADLAVRFVKAWDQTRFREFDLAATIRAIEVLWEDPRIKLLVRGPLIIIGDPELLEHAVVELVGNALRFAPKRGGEVIVRAYRQRRRRTRVQPSTTVIEVEDNGPGVAQDQKESIFRPYQTCDHSRPGLGLSIVKSAAEVHRGYVQECGVPGEGACFRMVLPQRG